jgi:hypothetical protein
MCRVVKTTVIWRSDSWLPSSFDVVSLVTPLIKQCAESLLRLITGCDWQPSSLGLCSYDYVLNVLTESWLLSWFDVVTPLTVRLDSPRHMMCWLPLSLEVLNCDSPHLLMCRIVDLFLAVYHSLVRLCKQCRKWEKRQLLQEEAG